MQKILEDIQTGKFAREWMLENMANRPVFNALTKADEEHLIEDVGCEVRVMMPQFRREPAPKDGTKESPIGYQNKKTGRESRKRKK